MRVSKHGCGVKKFCFSRANHASTNLKKCTNFISESRVKAITENNNIRHKFQYFITVNVLQTMYFLGSHLPMH